MLQAGRRHPRHPAGRSWRQRSRCQNPGEFPGPHGAEEDKEWRARPEGPGPRGNGRSWGRPGRRGRRPQRRLDQVRRAGSGGRQVPPFPSLGPAESGPGSPHEGTRRLRAGCGVERKLRVGDSHPRPGVGGREEAEGAAGPESSPVPFSPPSLLPRPGRRTEHFQR